MFNIFSSNYGMCVCIIPYITIIHVSTAYRGSQSAAHERREVLKLVSFFQNKTLSK